MVYLAEYGLVYLNNLESGSVKTSKIVSHRFVRTNFLTSPENGVWCLLVQLYQNEMRDRSEHVRAVGEL